MEERVGAWMCQGSQPTQSPITSGTSTPTSEYCNNWGCWSVFDDFFAEFNTTSIYLGYGGNTIANAHFLVEWHLVGAQTTALPVQSRVSIYTVNTIFSGALANGADGVAGGGAVKARCSPNTQPAAAGGILVSYSNGCRLSDKTSYDHNEVIEGSWSFSNYPGYWYFYVRSPVAHAPDKATFRFDQADELAGDSSVGGYNA